MMCGKKLAELPAEAASVVWNVIDTPLPAQRACAAMSWNRRKSGLRSLTTRSPPPLKSWQRGPKGRGRAAGSEGQRRPFLNLQGPQYFFYTCGPKV